MIIIQLLTSLEKIHERGIVHLCISPESLAFGAENMNKNLYLINFKNSGDVGSGNVMPEDNLRILNWFSSRNLHLGDWYCK